MRCLFGLHIGHADDKTVVTNPRNTEMAETDC